MKQRSLSESIVALLGLVFGFVFWVIKLLVSVVQEIVKSVTGTAKSDSPSGETEDAKTSASRLGEKASRIASQGAEKTRAASEDAKHKVEKGSANGSSEARGEMDQSATEPDVAPEEMTDGADFDAVGMAARGDVTTSERAQLAEKQHSEIGDVPNGDDVSAEDDVLAGRDTLSISREPGSSDAGAFSYGAAPFGAQIDEGADDVLSDGDEMEAEVEEAAQIHEGIGNIDEPGGTDATNTYADVNDSGPDMSEDDAYEQAADIGEAPFVTDGPESQEDIPSASRGLLDADELIDEPRSTTGGEVDLVNDEADAFGDAGMSIVDSPNDSLSTDAVSEPITNEPTLGLRDSESPDAPHNDDDEDASSSGEHLGLSGNFDRADEVETIPAEMVDGSAASDAGDQHDQNASSSSSASSAAWATTSGIVDTDLNQPEDVDTSGAAGAGENASADAGASARGGDIDDTLESSFGDGTVVGEESDVASGHGAIDDTFQVPDANTDQDASSSLADSTAADQASGSDAVPSSSLQDADTQPPKKQRTRKSDLVPNNAVRGDGSGSCPVDYPIKGNANSRIYHRPADGSYNQTIPEYCFATEEDAQAAGFRPRKE